MFRHEMSTFLQAVLDAVWCAGGLSVDGGDEPDGRFLQAVAHELRATPDEIRLAIAGLRACHSLVEDVLELPGIEPVIRLRVHPQCQPAPSERQL